MTKHRTGTRNEWLAERRELLKAEKEHTRKGDELARRRQALPWVRIDKPYRFDTDQGGASLADLFRGRSQLLVYHYMFGPEYTAGGATCSTITACCGRCRGRRSPSSRRTSGGWAGAFPGRPRSAATSTPTSTSPSPRSSSEPERSNTTTSAPATRWTPRRSRRSSPTTRRWPAPTWPPTRASGRA